MTEENFLLKHFGFLQVQCTIRLPKGSGKCHLIIAAPGFLEFKDWGFFPYLCQQLCQAGFATLSFTHALGGVINHSSEITDPEAFARNTTTQELRDWELVLDSILNGGLPHSQRLRLNAIGIVGHSRGGSYGILMAERVRQIQSVVAWGAIRTFDRFGPEAMNRWRETGSLEVQSSDSGKPLRLNVGALEALERNRSRLDVLGAMRSLNIPILLIHGREDRRVPVSEAQQLHQRANAELSRLFIVERAGHTFRTPHPFSAPSQPLMEATGQTVQWFAKTLKSDHSVDRSAFREL